jgi:hypothetical protein
MSRAERRTDDAWRLERTLPAAVRMVCNCREQLNLYLGTHQDLLLSMMDNDLGMDALLALLVLQHRAVRLVWSWGCPQHGSLSLELRWAPESTAGPPKAAQANPLQRKGSESEPNGLRPAAARC